MAKPVVLKVLLRRRHLQSLPAFIRQYDRVATQVDPALTGRGPSKAQFYRWLAGEMRGLPYPDHCRILEAMFPGWTAAQLFQPHDGEPESVPAPPEHRAAPSTTKTADVTAVYATRSAFAHEFPPHRLFDGAKKINLVGLSLNMLCQQFPDRALLELLDAGTVVNALFLDPAGAYIAAREQEEGQPPDTLSTLTRLNIQALQRIQAKLSPDGRGNLTIRTYDQPPRFNITVVDDALCVVQPYLPGSRGVESPTFVAESRIGTAGVFATFADVFTTMWATADEVTT